MLLPTGSLYHPDNQILIMLLMNNFRMDFYTNVCLALYLVVLSRLLFSSLFVFGQKLFHCHDLKITK